MKIDVVTLNLVMIVFAVIQSLILLSQHRLNRPYQGLGWWALGSLALAAGFALQTLRDVDFLRAGVIIVGNALLAAPLILFHIGIARFLEKKDQRFSLLALWVGFVIVYSYYTLVNDDASTRVLLMSAIVAFTSFLNAWTLLREPLSPRKPSSFWTAFAFIIHGLFFVLRAVGTVVVGGEYSYFAPTLMQITMFLVIFTCNNLWTFGFVSMVNQRLHDDLEESRERFKLIFNTSPDAAIISRLDDGKIDDVNEGFLALTGYARRETVGKRSTEVSLWKDAEDRQKFVVDLSSRGICENVEADFLRKDGSEVQGLVSAKITTLQGIPHIISITRDISARKQAEDAVRRSESLYRSILAASPDGVSITELEGRIRMVSPKALQMFGFHNEAELLGQEHLNFIIPADRERARTNIELMFQGVFTGPAEYGCFTADGKIFDIEANAEFVRDRDGNPTNLMIIIREISERKQAEATQMHNIAVQLVLSEIAGAALLAPSMTELFATVHSLVGRVFPAKFFHINLLNEKTGEIVVPYRADEVNFISERRPIGKGMTEYIMRLGHAVHVTPADMDRLRESGECDPGKVQNAQVRHYLGAPLINPQGKPFGVMSLIVMGEANPFLPEDLEVFSIIAAQVSMAIDRKRLEEELKQQAMTDGLTGVLNRRYFMLRLDEELRRIRRYTSDCALLILDMDHFKQINDTYGHAVGDEVLRQVAAICGGVLRDTDVLGRIGGEEFGILLLEGSAEVSLQVAERLRQSVEDVAFCTDQGFAVPLSVSIGATECLQTESVATVLRRADKALYLAKNRGRNQVAFCSATSSEIP